ncbi:MAG: RNA polymerase sigma-70 factor, ECF subfamily [Sporanaerobacter sp.]|jgi:RNA polymerase sigma factor (sigma-70 family)|uniref:RNA polymerase sigma factor n=1 Tax=Sporanaerobacter sp. TaxID=2010183 RepID=UPI003A10275D
METELLIKKAKKGDKEALLQLVMAHEADYYKLAYVYMKNKDDALDAMQDMIVILYENMSKLKKEESFYSWSKTILVNLCKNKLKKNNKVIPLDEIKAEAQYETYDKSENQIVLEKHLSKLSEKQQEVIRLKYFLDLDYKTISEILKIPIGTVKSRISIGIEKLRESIGGDSIE